MEPEDRQYQAISDSDDDELIRASEMWETPFHRPWDTPNTDAASPAENLKPELDLKSEQRLLGVETDISRLLPRADIPDLAVTKSSQTPRLLSQKSSQKQRSKQSANINNEEPVLSDGMLVSNDDPVCLLETEDPLPSAEEKAVLVPSCWS